MKLNEYVKIAITELKAFEKKYSDNAMIDPDNWPLDLREDGWGQQELAERF